jgi:serine phosphatase RsbU (regulator of sigma subunit)
VGGDFYDWYRVDEAFQFVVADVMGKGIPAALIGASMRSLLRGASHFDDIEKAVNRAAEVIEPDLAETAAFVTLFAARLDPDAHVVTYVDAGHGIAGVVSADGRVRRIESKGLPLGVPQEGPWRAEALWLHPGDTLLCFSDGLLDLFGSLDDAMAAARRTVLESSSAREIVTKVAEFSRRHEAVDDATVVVVRRSA